MKSRAKEKICEKSEEQQQKGDALDGVESEMI